MNMWCSWSIADGYLCCKNKLLLVGNLIQFLWTNVAGSKGCNRTIKCFLHKQLLQEPRCYSFILCTGVSDYKAGSQHPSDWMRPHQGSSPASCSKWSSYEIDLVIQGFHLVWSQNLQGWWWWHNLFEPLLQSQAVLMGKKMFMTSRWSLPFQLIPVLQVTVSSLHLCSYNWYYIASNILIFVAIQTKLHKAVWEKYSNYMQ